MATGHEEYDDGNVKVIVNGVVMADRFQNKRTTVVNQCWDVLETIQLSGPTDDAWRGQVIIISKGNPTSITCEECSGSTTLLSGSIVVDWGSDSISLGDTQCVNGKTCDLTWKIIGS